MAGRNCQVIVRARPLSDESPPRLRAPQPEEHAITASLYSKALDILNSPPGQRAIRSLLAFYFWDERPAMSTQPHIVNHSRLFLNKVETSPLITLDEGIQSEQVIGYHPRGTWEGESRDFDPRQQAIVVNKPYLDAVLQAKAAWTNDPVPQNLHWFYQAEFRIVTMFFHELSHVCITYINNGRYLTPDHIRSAMPRKIAAGGMEEPEAGEFMERNLTRGLVEFNDGHAWLYIGRGTAQQIDPNTIAALMAGRIPQDDTSRIVGLTNVTRPAVHEAGGRARLHSRSRRQPVSVSEGRMMSARARSDMTPTAVSNFRYPGQTLPVTYLRRLTAHPSRAALAV